ncbi:hypothetical protein V7S43_005335 [Phytophthora oleae]|uniref:Uncharacterized protein n=1 Tax=Phytophthora oleae TaxID=2107226 RepID=A0ABD3FSP7_9STRA
MFRCMLLKGTPGQEDEEQMTEEEVEEQLDDLMQHLENEHNSEVRVEIGKLVFG